MTQSQNAAIELIKLATQGRDPYTLAQILRLGSQAFSESYPSYARLCATSASHYERCNMERDQMDLFDAPHFGFQEMPPLDPVPAPSRA